MFVVETPAIFVGSCSTVREIINTCRILEFGITIRDARPYDATRSQGFHLERGMFNH